MLGTKYPVVSLDHTVSDDLEGLFRSDGAFHPIVERVRMRPGMLDLQMRHVRGEESTVCVRAGSTTVLEITQRGGTLTLEADADHRAAGGVEVPWSVAVSLASAADVSPAVEAYLDAVLTTQTAAFTDKQGIVRGSLGTGASPHYRCLQRDADISFLTTPIRDQLVDPLRHRIWDAIQAARERSPWWPTVDEGRRAPLLALSIDALALDADGHLLTIEAKPANDGTGVAWAPAQTRLYAEVIALWLEADPEARAVIVSICEQRHRLGLPAPDWAPQPHARLRVVPVVAVGPIHTLQPDVFANYLARVWKVADALEAAPPHSARLDPMQVWRLDEQGDRQVVVR